MQESGFKSYDELPLFLNAKAVAKILGVSPSSGYELMHEPGFPVLRVGKPHGSAQGTIHSMGRGTHRRWL